MNKMKRGNNSLKNSTKKTPSKHKKKIMSRTLHLKKQKYKLKRSMSKKKAENNNKF